MCSTRQKKLPNASLQHYSEYTDLKYTCNIGNINTFSKQRKVNSVTIEIQQQQYFISSQLSPNPMAPHVAVPIEAGQENH